MSCSASRLLSRAGGRIAAVAAVAAGLAALGTGCGDTIRRPRNITRDAVPTEASAGVLADYGQTPAFAAPRRELPELRPGRGIAVPPAPPELTLPGPAERPWEGPPRTVAQPVLPDDNRVREPVAPELVSPGPRTGGRALRPGDTVRVDVEGHPEFGGKWRVMSDGMLDIPATGVFSLPDFAPADFARRLGRAAGGSPEDAARRVAEQLRPYVRRRPAVTVTVIGRGDG